MRRFFAGMILVLALSGISWADIVYTTGTGNLGVIGIRGPESIDAPSVQYSGLGDSALPVSYWSGTASRLMVIDRTTDTSASGDTALIFSTSNLTSPSENRITLNGIYNTQSASSTWNGRGMFFASRENASVVELDTSNFSTVHSYKFVPESTDTSTPYMDGLLESYWGVYALVNQGEDSSFLLMFDGQLKDNVSGFIRITFDAPVHSMAWLSNYRLTIGYHSGVDVVGRYANNRLLTTEHPVVALCRDSDTGFFFITREESGDEYVNTLSHYYLDGMVSAVQENVAGENCKLLDDTKTNTAAAIIGGTMFIYDLTSGELKASYTSADLGGVPLNMTLRQASGDNYESSSSSCNIGGAGMFLMMSCAVMMMKMKK